MARPTSYRKRNIATSEKTTNRDGKRAYMKEYMKTRRLDPQFRLNENEVKARRGEVKGISEVFKIDVRSFDKVTQEKWRGRAVRELFKKEVAKNGKK